MSRSKFKNKVRAAAVKFVPDGVILHAIRQGGQWHARVEGEDFSADAQAKGLMDVMQKVFFAWHAERGTQLAKLVRDAEKEAAAAEDAA